MYNTFACIEQMLNEEFSSGMIPVREELLPDITGEILQKPSTDS
jgi:hypothetical protein